MVGRVVTGSRDDTAIVWDAETGQELLTLHGHTEDITSARFSDDGLPGSHRQPRRNRGAVADDKSREPVVWESTTDFQVRREDGNTSVECRSRRRMGFQPVPSS
jgi:WD40 repeat protein